jgi:hypothetical protein
MSDFGSGKSAEHHLRNALNVLRLSVEMLRVATPAGRCERAMDLFELAPEGQSGGGAGASPH